jgi:hypothetical protein
LTPPYTPGLGGSQMPDQSPWLGPNRLVLFTDLGVDECSGRRIFGRRVYGSTTLTLVSSTYELVAYRNF